MKILIIYQLPAKTDRNTISEHLLSFKKYAPDVDFHYINIYKVIPWYIRFIKYDAVILHYTYLAGERFLENPEPWLRKTANLEKIKGYKVAIPQDEYDHTDRNCELFLRAGIKAIYTCFYLPEDIKKVYPEQKTGVKDIFEVFTGYVDEQACELLKGKTPRYADRPIDIGYRARKLPAYFGKHGQLKYELVEFFEEVLKGRELVYDITNTNQSLTSENANLVKLGNTWYDFLLSCKTFIGCEGGSSLLDRDGQIKKKVLEYAEKFPDAPFSEFEENCFKDQDYNISCFAISPRHFEAAMCKTLQILVEGYYGGIFKPWQHYIPLKRDFSNIEEVLTTLKDEDRCQKIIDTAYTDIVLSGKYTYRSFVEQVCGYLRQKATSTRPGFFYKITGVLLNFRNDRVWVAYKLEELANRFYWFGVRVKNRIGSIVLYDILRRPKKHLIQ